MVREDVGGEAYVDKDIRWFIVLRCSGAVLGAYIQQFIVLRWTYGEGEVGIARQRLVGRTLEHGRLGHAEFVTRLMRRDARFLNVLRNPSF